jgi:hypothetical protein
MERRNSNRSRQARQLWCRQHDSATSNWGRNLQKYFHGQALRIANAADDFDQIDASIIPLIFRPFDEAELLKPLTHRHGLQMMAVGAKAELDRMEAHKAVKLNPDDFGIDLPDNVLQRILASLEDLEAQPYWQAIQQETERRLATIINDGLETGWSNWRISKEIRDQLGGFDARKRGMKIARPPRIPAGGGCQHGNAFIVVARR